MSWEVEYVDEFEKWWNNLGDAEQESVDASVRLLEQMGPNFPFPHSSGVEGSKHGYPAGSKSFPQEETYLRESDTS